MAVTGNILKNNSLTQMAQQAGPRVMSAIQDASARTGVNFAYLVEKAAAESSFDTSIQSKTSSATGLYQFIESTWLQMVRDHGAKYGLGDYAAKIDANGRVTDKAARKDILELRKDPETAAFMAAEFAAGNQRYLEEHLGGKAAGDIGSTELYLAHFMGAGGATAFLKAYHDNPLAAAADLFPQAARANRNVFYDRQTGQPRTLAGVYDFFDKKFSDGDGAPAPAPAGRYRVAADADAAAPSAAERAGAPTATRFFTAGGQTAFSYRAKAATADAIYSYAAGKTRPVATTSYRGAVQPSELLLLAQLQAPGNIPGAQDRDERGGWPRILSRPSNLFMTH